MSPLCTCVFWFKISGSSSLQKEMPIPQDSGEVSQRLTLRGLHSLAGMGESYWHLNAVGCPPSQTLARTTDANIHPFWHQFQPSAWHPSLQPKLSLYVSSKLSLFQAKMQLFCPSPGPACARSRQAGDRQGSQGPSLTAATPV